MLQVLTPLLTLLVNLPSCTASALTNPGTSAVKKTLKISHQADTLFNIFTNNEVQIYQKDLDERSFLRYEKLPGYGDVVFEINGNISLSYDNNSSYKLVSICFAALNQDCWVDLEDRSIFSGIFAPADLFQTVVRYNNANQTYLEYKNTSFVHRFLCSRVIRNFLKSDTVYFYLVFEKGKDRYASQSMVVTCSVNSIPRSGTLPITRDHYRFEILKNLQNDVAQHNAKYPNDPITFTPNRKSQPHQKQPNGIQNLPNMPRHPNQNQSRVIQPHVINHHPQVINRQPHPNHQQSNMNNLIKQNQPHPNQQHLVNNHIHDVPTNLDSPNRVEQQNPDGSKPENSLNPLVIIGISAAAVVGVVIIVVFIKCAIRR